MQTTITKKSRNGEGVMTFSKVGKNITIHTKDNYGRGQYKIGLDRLRNIVDTDGVFQNLFSTASDPLVIYRRGDEILIHNTYSTWKFGVLELDKVIYELSQPYGDIRRANMA